MQGEIDNMDVPADGCRVLIDRLAPDSPPLPEGFTPLEIVGLDATISQRGVRIFEGRDAALPGTAGWVVRTLRPLHALRYPG